MNRNNINGNPDEREKNRKLTEAEQKRMERFEMIAEELSGRGYRRTDLTISIVNANIFAIFLLIPLAVIGALLFYIRHRTLAAGLGSYSLLYMAVAFLILIVIHELIHGASWAIFTERHFRDIEFGFMKQYFTPYCTCVVPLSKGPYIFGALTPLILLGIVPMIIGILIGSMPVLIVGILMADAASGDIMIVWNILRYRSEAENVVYMDHPTQAGGVIFEK